MSSHRSLQQGIEAIRAGNPQAGARLIRIALKDETITGELRAAGEIWLASTSRDPAFRIACYERALDADPGNHIAQHRLATLLTPPDEPAAAAPPPPPTMPETWPASGATQPSQAVDPPPTNAPPPATASYHIVGILGGPLGPGSGFFVGQNGVIATTRSVVGSEQNVTVELETQRQLRGRVIRAHPEMDLAFVHVEQPVSDLLPVTPFPDIAPDTTLRAISYNTQTIVGHRRDTSRALQPHWFPTDIALIQLPDAGGCPIFGEQNYLVGMLTRNISSSSAYVFGLHIATIRRTYELYLRDTQNAAHEYCVACGFISRAAAAGGYYCEHCGAAMPRYRGPASRRVPLPQTSAFYEEDAPSACPVCRSRAGFHNGVCLRCGQTGTPPAPVSGGLT